MSNSLRAYVDLFEYEKQCLFLRNNVKLEIVFSGFLFVIKK